MALCDPIGWIVHCNYDSILYRFRDIISK